MGIRCPSKHIQVNWARKPCSEVLRDPSLVQSRNSLPGSGQKLVSPEQCLSHECVHWGAGLVEDDKMRFPTKIGISSFS